MSKTQYADHASMVTSLPIVEQVLGDHALELGDDFVGYRNHVYRVVNLCLAIAADNRAELEKITVAAVFHDLGIWTNHTFDYIDPSVALAREYLAARGLGNWIPEIEAMIADHHKVTPSHANPHPSTIAQGALSGVEGQSLIESFRRADWIDVSRGLRTFGLPRTFIAAVDAAWPNAGFHRRLVQLTIDRFLKHPLSPLPMVKW
jgi:hypothetical protein